MRSRAARSCPRNCVRSQAQCLAALHGRPQFYTTSIAVRDLDAVRAALGYAEINVFGGSYGTRVAQHYARRYPGHTRTVILDGVVPPGLALVPGIAIESQRALDRVFARCAADKDCDSHFPALAAQFAKLDAALRKGPIPVSLADPVTGASRTIEVTRAHLVTMARMLVYSPWTASLAPARRARGGDERELRAARRAGGDGERRPRAHDRDGHAQLGRLRRGRAALRRRRGPQGARGDRDRPADPGRHEGHLRGLAARAGGRGFCEAPRLEGPGTPPLRRVRPGDACELWRDCGEGIRERPAPRRAGPGTRTVEPALRAENPAPVHRCRHDAEISIRAASRASAPRPSS